jgi:hypothetical protein
MLKVLPLVHSSNILELCLRYKLPHYGAVSDSSGAMCHLFFRNSKSTQMLSLWPNFACCQVSLTLRLNRLPHWSSKDLRLERKFENTPIAKCVRFIFRSCTLRVIHLICYKLPLLQTAHPPITITTKTTFKKIQTSDSDRFQMWCQGGSREVAVLDEYYSLAT